MNESEETVKGQTSDRRKLGEGTVDQRPSGKWRARVRLPDGSRVSKTFNTEAEADSFRRGVVSVTAEGDDTGDVTPGLTLAKWGETLFEQRELDGVRSVDREVSLWNTHIAPDLGEMQLRDIDRPTVVAWHQALRSKQSTVSVRGGGRRSTGKRLSRQTLVHALRLLRVAMSAALDAGHIDANPVVDIKVARRADGVKDAWTYLTAQEVEGLAACAALPIAERTIYLMAIYTGLRRGELWALRWGDVRLEDGAPEVTVRASNAGATKSGKVRRVPLLPAVLDALKAWKGKGNKRPHAFVFPAESGGRRGEDDDARWSPRQVVNKRGERVDVCGYRLRAGIKRKVRFHDMRHTCASHLLMGTWGVKLPLEEVREWLGHSSVTVTERYAHLSPDRLAARVASAVSQDPPAPPALGPEVKRGPAKSSVITGARGARFEPATFGFGGGRTPEQGRDLAPVWDPVRTQCAAKALLVTVAQGQPVGAEVIDALVSAVLGTEVVTLALAAREPGPSSLMYALRLAAAVCEAGAAWEALKSGGGR